MKTPHDVLNFIIAHRGFKSYLEIGVAVKLTFKKINIQTKVCVDPHCRADYKMTSDTFFDQCADKYDLIFIDGLHLMEQVNRDIDNSLRCLNHGGIIVVHDCNPKIEPSQFRGQSTAGVPWNGDVWKAWVKKRERDDLEMFVYDADQGFGIIRRGKQEPFITKLDLTWDNLVKHRQEWLNLKNVEYFKSFIS